MNAKTIQSKDLPATQGMLQLVRNEVKSDVRQLRSEMKAEFKRMDVRFNKVDARFNEVDARFNEVHARIGKVEAAVEDVLSAVHGVAAQVARVGILVEEQNSRNRIVLEGLTGLAQRQDRVEARMESTEMLVRTLARAGR